MKLSLTELDSFAKKFVAELPHAQGAHAHVVGLKGELGSGKTTFVQMVARELAVTETVTSPTFTILKSYTITHPVFERLIHIDAYRLSPNESDTIKWHAYLKDPRNLIVVEWPENLNGFPPDSRVLAFGFVDPNTREVNHHAA